MRRDPRVWQLSWGEAVLNQAPERELLRIIYAAFNARDIKAVLRLMHPEVVWPNGWEGGWVHGHQGIRAYWTRQWKAIDPHVEPISFSTGVDGRTIVKVHQVVRDLEGKVVADGIVEHVYTFEDGFVIKMEN